MSEEGKIKTYTISETQALLMLINADQQLEIAADLLDGKVSENPLDMKVVSFLCDSFSCNYHTRKILKTVINFNTLVDEKTKEKIIFLEETDFLILENAVLSYAFLRGELLKLNYSLSLH